MNVSLAAQIFSNSFFSALMTGSSTGVLKSETTVATANFVKNINDIFDCLNARHRFDPNPLKRGLSDQNSDVENRLRDAVTYIDIWSIQNYRKPDCFDNFALTINSILLLWDVLKEEGKPYLLTSRLNQDTIENFLE